MIWVRFQVTDEVWEKVADLFPGEVIDCGDGRDNRLTLEGGFVARFAPPISGKPDSVFKRFRCREKNGVSERPLRLLPQQPDIEHVPIDGTIISVHQKASGAGRDSRSGHRRFELLPGQRHDLVGIKGPDRKPWP